MPNLHPGAAAACCGVLPLTHTLASHLFAHVTSCLCVQLIQKSNIKAVHVLGSSSDLQLVLAGQAPRVALEVVHSAIHFCE